MLQQPFDQGAMAQMQAIKAADRYDTVARLNGFQSAGELHGPQT
jgi:hypothetical protein